MYSYFTGHSKYSEEETNFSSYVTEQHGNNGDLGYACAIFQNTEQKSFSIQSQWFFFSHLLEGFFFFFNFMS